MLFDAVGDLLVQLGWGAKGIGGTGGEDGLATGEEIAGDVCLAGVLCDQGIDVGALVGVGIGGAVVEQACGEDVVFDRALERGGGGDGLIGGGIFDGEMVGGTEVLGDDGDWPGDGEEDGGF